MRPIVYVLNGPNLNLLGSRQPELYGRETLADVESECRRAGAELGLEIEFRQTNAEFQLIDWIHEAGGRAAGIVINPAAFSHTSVAVLDALNTCAFPILEVHISNIPQTGRISASFFRFGSRCRLHLRLWHARLRSCDTASCPANFKLALQLIIDREEFTKRPTGRVS